MIIAYQFFFPFTDESSGSDSSSEDETLNLSQNKPTEDQKQKSTASDKESFDGDTNFNRPAKRAKTGPSEPPPLQALEPGHSHSTVVSSHNTGISQDGNPPVLLKYIPQHQPLLHPSGHTPHISSHSNGVHTNELTNSGIPLTTNPPRPIFHFPSETTQSNGCLRMGHSSNLVTVHQNNHIPVSSVHHHSLAHSPAFRRTQAVELLLRLFPEQNRHVLELILRGCDDDIVQAIECILPSRDRMYRRSGSVDSATQGYSCQDPNCVYNQSRNEGSDMETGSAFSPVNSGNSRRHVESGELANTESVNRDSIQCSRVPASLHSPPETGSNPPVFIVHTSPAGSPSIERSIEGSTETNNNRQNDLKLTSCSVCGKKASGTDNFCSSCGRRLQLRY